MNRSDALGPGILTAGPVIEFGVICPTIPQALDHRHELLGAFVAIRVADLGVSAVVARGCSQPGGDNVPPDPPATDMIQRRELPCQIERLGVRRGGRGDQANAAGADRQCGQHRDGL